MKRTLPGLFDLQVNGFAGVDYNRPDVSVESLQNSLGVMRSTGVTRCLPTIITSSTEHFARCLFNLLRTGDESIAGFHMEGPYISPLDGYRGAHPLAHVTPASIDDFRRRQEAADGRIVLVTLAPEVEGAFPLIEYLVAQGIVVAIGHTAASAACIHDAATAGATLCTHLGNGCAGTVDRHLNPLWPQLADDRLIASFIADGFHLPDDVLHAMVKAKGADRTLLVTDAMAGAAAPPGDYTLGDIRASVDAHGRVSQPPAGNLAGSALRLDYAVMHAIRTCRLSLDQAWHSASTLPALVLGLPPAPAVEIEWDAPLGIITVL